MKKITLHIVALWFIVMLASCGSGGNGGSGACTATATNGIMTCDTGLGPMIDQQLHVMSNGDLYLFGSHYVAASATTGYYAPILAKSTNGGATWTTTGVAQLAGIAPTLYNTASATDGTTIMVTGGATGYPNQPNLGNLPSYSTSIYSYNRTTNSWKISTAPFTGRVNHAMAYDNVKNIFYVSGGAQLYNTYDATAKSYTWYSYIHFTKWKSSDGGASWLNVTASVTDSNAATLGQTAIYHHCMLANAGNLYLIGGYKAPIVTTTGSNGGSIGYSSKQEAKTTIDQSTDGGLTWTTMSSSQPSAPIDAACTNNGSTFYSTGGISVSTDPVTNVQKNFVSNEIRISTDSGATWQSEASTARAQLHGFRSGHSIAVQNNKLIVIGGNTVGTPNYKTDVLDLPL